MKTQLLLIIAIFTISLAVAQPVITWQKSLGGSEDDKAQSIAQTSDGGYVVAGTTRSNDGDVSNTIVSERSIWIVKLDANGVMQWEKAFGGNDFDEANEIQQTADGGYIVIGSSESDDFIGNFIGNQDIIIFKLDASGVFLWGKRYGGTGLDSGYSIKQTTDGGYIASGSINVPGNLANLWVAKLDVNGDIAASWSNTQFFGGDNETALSVDQTSDGGYIISGVADFGTGNNRDFWIIKLDGISNIVWQKTFGGIGSEFGRSVQQTSDGGYIVAGSSDSNDGDVTNNYGLSDIWVVKLDAMGDIQWQQTYGGSLSDVAFSIQQTTDGGYVVAGQTASDDNDVSGNPGTNIYDYWVIKLTNSGDLSWQTCLGGSGNDNGRSIVQTSDGGYAVAGYAFSNNYDVSGNNGRWDFWVVKLGGETLGMESPIINHDINVYPNPVSETLFISTQQQIEQIEMYDLLGKKLLTLNNTHYVDVNRFPSGIYMLKIITNQGQSTKRVLINH